MYIPFYCNIDGMINITFKYLTIVFHEYNIILLSKKKTYQVFLHYNLMIFSF